MILFTTNMDYYKILEIDKNSTTREIKKHYYKLAKKYHPDKNNGISDENFKLLSEAYSTLSNLFFFYPTSC